MESYPPSDYATVNREGLHKLLDAAFDKLIIFGADVSAFARPGDDTVAVYVDKWDADEYADDTPRGAKVARDAADARESVAAFVATTNAVLRAARSDDIGTETAATVGAATTLLMRTTVPWTLDIEELTVAAQEMRPRTGYERLPFTARAMSLIISNPMFIREVSVTYAAWHDRPEHADDLQVSHRIGPADDEVLRQIRTFFIHDHDDYEGARTLLDLAEHVWFGGWLPDLGAVYERYPGPSDTERLERIVQGVRGKAAAIDAEHIPKFGRADLELPPPSATELAHYVLRIQTIYRPD